MRKEISWPQKRSDVQRMDVFINTIYRVERSSGPI